MVYNPPKFKPGEFVPYKQITSGDCLRRFHKSCWLVYWDDRDDCFHLCDCTCHDVVGHTCGSCGKVLTDLSEETCPRCNLPTHTGGEDERFCGPCNSGDLDR